MSTEASSFHSLDETKLYPLRKDIFDVTADFTREKASTVGKIISNFLDHAFHWGWVSKENSMAKEAHFHAKCFKYIHSGPLQLVSSFNSVTKATGDMLEDPSVYRVGQTIREVNGLIGPTKDSADLFTRIIFHISKESYHTLSGISGASLLLWAGWNGLDNVVDLGNPKKNKTTSDTIQHMLKLAKHISYVVLGILIVGNHFFALGAANILFTACTTATAFFAVAQYYHKNLGQVIKIN